MNEKVVIEIQLDEDIFHISVIDKHVKLKTGKAVNPSLVLTTSKTCFLELVTYNLNPVHALAEGKCSLKGDINKLNECLFYLNL